MEVSTVCNVHKWFQTVAHSNQDKIVYCCSCSLLCCVCHLAIKCIDLNICSMLHFIHITSRICLTFEIVCSSLSVSFLWAERCTETWNQPLPLYLYIIKLFVAAELFHHYTASKELFVGWHSCLTYMHKIPSLNLIWNLTVVIHGFP